MSVLRRLIVLCSVAAISASLFGQSVPLNPTVKVLPNARTIVPPECVEGGAPAPIIAEAPRETAPAAAAPPSIDLKTRLRRVQAAAERDDRDEFKRALADARSAVNAYPTGGERDAANDVMQIDSDLEKIWDYAFNSASGAFIDANGEGGVMTSIIRRYPDYNRFIRDSTLTVGGQVIYPTRETRQFLTTEAARRLARLGVRVPARVAEQPPAPVPQRHPPSTVIVTKPVPPAKHPTTTAHRAAAKPSHKPPTKKVASAAVTPPKPRVAEKTTTSSPPATTQTQRAAGGGGAPPIATTTTTTVGTGGGAPTVLTATTTTTATAGSGVPPIPTTTTVDTTATSTTSTEQRPASGGGRMNVLFAVILIVVGIGVLIVLFRASD